RAARDLILRHPDRIVFGSDASPPDAAVYEVDRRFLQTPDEHFPYDAGPQEQPSQGRWAISGLDLPADALAKVCSGNARRLIPGLTS
ncbi:MAG: amidohydrolase family protein, partial [Actinomycetota bacterium]